MTHRTLLLLTSTLLGLSHAQGVSTGLERLLTDPGPLAGQRIGLISNATSVDRHLAHAADLIHAHPALTLAALFAPEHGFRGTAQAGEHVGGTVDARTGVVIHSLYGDTRRPTAAMLEGVDVLVFDIQDVGTRFYTYISTLYYALEAAALHDKAVVVLDRPNPLGGVVVEGPRLEPELRSFVGVYPLPIRHGMTVAELALLFNADIGAALTVVPMDGWRRAMTFDETGLPWVMPSPNMPTLDSARVYGGTGLLEGTNLSEGRGTTRPFELIGAPFIDADALTERLNALALPGVRFRPVVFTPTFAKYQGEEVHGVQVHVTAAEQFEAVRTGLAVLALVREQHPDAFAIDRPEHFDLLAGNRWLREALIGGESVTAMTRRWQADLEAFRQQRAGFLRYD